MSGEGKYRVELDTMGEVKVPQDRLYGAQTQRSRNNFKIGKLDRGVYFASLNFSLSPRSVRGV